MQQANGSRSVAEVVAGIEALDLAPIKVKLMDVTEGYGWTREYADRMETAYKRFLILLVTCPEAIVAPTREIDRFWHAHILDTRKYADDCGRVFGYFLHHFPYFGMRGEADAAALARASTDFHRLYAERFGEELPVRGLGAGAFCFAEKAVGKNVAFCFAEKTADRAFCFAEKSAVDSAFCFAEQSAADSAFCFAEKSAAFCFAEKATASASAFCFAANPAVSQVDTETRPTLV